MSDPSSPPALDGTVGRRTREKIVILGGGVGAIAAAFALTDQPDWRDRYDITVYQLGWRLGGKGASGRNLDLNARIEEHGLHVWMGFYENAFRLIRRCYAELNRPADSPLSTWYDPSRPENSAFIPQNFICYTELIEGQWSLWPVTYPFNDDVPGDGGIGTDPWDFILLVLSWLRQMLSEAPPSRAAAALHPDEVPAAGDGSAGFTRSRGALASLAREVAAGVQAIGLTAVGIPIQTARWVTWALARGKTPLRDEDLRHLADHLATFQKSVWHRLRDRIEADPTARHLWIEIDLMFTVAIGMLLDGVITHGFGAIDDRDFSEWLIENGADEAISVRSSWVRATYDFVFGFSRARARPAPRRSSGRRIDPTLVPELGEERRLAAGVGLRGLLRLALTYKGALCWKMAAGMGDVVFAPLYQVLKERGVKFQFFHRVEQLHLSGDGASIERIELTRQATVKNGGAYDPLVVVKGLPCWPSQPRFDQLEEGLKLQARGLDLESYWAERPPWEVPLTLEKGRDFDQVVLGISLGALPIVARELVDASPAWKAMVANVQAVGTLSCQLWLKPTLAELGWEQPEDRTPPIVGAYVEPLSSWADMTHLVDREAWPYGAAPGTIAYFCGPLFVPATEAMLTDPALPDYFSGATYPDDLQRAVQETVSQFLQDDVANLWPKAVGPWTAPDGQVKDAALRWDCLVGKPGQSGTTCLEAQYFRANVDPSSLYVLSLPGTTKYRLKSDRSGFDNLFIAGDWTYNGINGGCVEAAVMSGLRAARGICGYPSEIIGESVD